MLMTVAILPQAVYIFMMQFSEFADIQWHTDKLKLQFFKKIPVFSKKRYISRNGLHKIPCK